MSEDDRRARRALGHVEQRFQRTDRTGNLTDDFSQRRVSSDRVCAKSSRRTGDNVCELVRPGDQPEMSGSHDRCESSIGPQAQVSRVKATGTTRSSSASPVTTSVGTLDLSQFALQTVVLE